MKVEKVNIFSKKKDYVGRLPNGKIVFIKTTAEFYPNNIPAIVKITEEKENYAFGELLIAESEEETQKKAENLAEAIDTWILEVSIEHIAQNYLFFSLFSSI